MTFTMRRAGILACSVALNAFFLLSPAATEPLAAAPTANAAATLNACDVWNTCPDPKSCGSWSSYFDCDDPFCEEDPTCYYSDSATYQLRERFRWCVLQDQSACMEVEFIAHRKFCGCETGQ